MVDWEVLKLLYIKLLKHDGEIEQVTHTAEGLVIRVATYPDCYVNVQKPRDYALITEYHLTPGGQLVMSGCRRKSRKDGILWSRTLTEPGVISAC